MIAEKYDFIGVEEDDYFEFIRIGPKGEITKVVQFTLIDPKQSIYNLGLGDKDPITNEINDNVSTNSRYLNDISKNFEIYGLKEQNHEWERFKESSDYIAFIINRN
jgi:hypothetical protein